MTKIIFLTGAPGTGKSTISKKLHKKLKDSALVELSWIRGYHLDDNWSNISEKEEQMSFENLIFIINNYIKNEYNFVIVNDLLGNQIEKLPQLFNIDNYFNFSLFVSDDNELKKRVIDDTRDSGYRDYTKALDWNKNLINRKALINEIKIDNTTNNPEETIEIILQHLNKN